MQSEKNFEYDRIINHNQCDIISEKQGIIEESSDQEDNESKLKTINAMLIHANGNIGGIKNLSGSSTNLQQISTPPRTPKFPRRPSVLLHEILSTRRPSAIMAAITRPGHLNPHRQRLGSLHEHVATGTPIRSSTPNNGPECDLALKSKKKNRRIGDDALSTALSALYCKLLVILGVAMPVTEILSSRIPTNIYQGFYLYLYIGSISFVIFVYVAHMRTKAVFTLIKTYHEKNDNYNVKKRTKHFGSFYLRVGAIAFGIGTMVYSGLEFGQYFELHGMPGCTNIFVALTPAARMALSIVQMQFIFLNTTELDIARNKVIARFGLMHMVATNLCEWLYVLVEETKHEIFHISRSNLHDMEAITNQYLEHKVLSTTTQATTISESPIVSTITTIVAEIFTNNQTNEFLSDITPKPLIDPQEAENYIDCQRTNIMGTLVQNASPFLFPCTIEYSLICAVILYEMWKKVRSLPEIERTRRNSKHPSLQHHKSAHHFSVDCARAHRGMFTGIMIIVMTIICLIMYFVLHDKPSYEFLAIEEVTICEILMYIVTIAAVIASMIKMRDLKYQKKTNDHHSSSVSLDCTLLVLAQTGVYVYAMFSIMGCYFAVAEGIPTGRDGLIAEILGLIQTSIQTLFILNACWRRCKGAQQNRRKPGREIVTFLLVANMSMWFINTLIKLRASFRPTHLEFFGVWAWTVITHVSMPLAIFYRFHSTICLFEIWKSAYKVKHEIH